MNLFNDWSRIEIIDNRDNPDIYMKGFSEMEDVTVPNRGRILESKVFKQHDEIYFYEYGILSVPNCGKLIQNKNIIMCNGRLQMPGILAGRITLQKFDDGFIMHSAIDYLQCIYSNIPDVKRGDVIIIGKNESQKINYHINDEYRRVSFIQPGSIRIVISQELKSIVPGPEMVFVDDPEPEDDFFVTNDPKTELEYGDTVYSKRLIHFTLSGKPKSVVRKTDLVLDK